MDWRKIEFGDIPCEEFERLTLNLLRQGITNSDRIRDQIRRELKLILSKATGNWNKTPSDKFVNEHAWVLEDLVVRKVIEKTAEKEYRLVGADVAEYLQWPSSQEGARKMTVRQFHRH